jgi:hypothetical protein
VSGAIERDPREVKAVGLIGLCSFLAIDLMVSWSDRSDPHLFFLKNFQAVRQLSHNSRGQKRVLIEQENVGKAILLGNSDALILGRSDSDILVVGD